MVGRVNYEYAGKYLFSAAIRRDGLSLWAPGKKYANFHRPPLAGVSTRSSLCAMPPLFLN